MGGWCLMGEIKLVLPSKGLEGEALEYRKEHFDHQEQELHGGSLLDVIDPYDAWLEQVKNNSDQRTVDPNWVVTTTFFAIRKSDERIVGMVSVRHTLNELLRDYGGHIGYVVRPSERNKGYAGEMLKLALEYCKTIGLHDILIACNKDNEASRRTITRSGGVLEKEFVHTDGKTVLRFRIAL
jgi:predicted acetyltransferase